MPSKATLQKCAIGISIISVLWNGIEGGVSIGFGAEVDSKSLLFFGVQSFIEVLSAILVVYRFRKVNNREMSELDASLLKLERRATFGIGCLFLVLSLSTWTIASISLARHDHPNSSLPSLIVASSALVIMILIWIPKIYLYKQLNSSVMKAEADCSLACIYLTTVLLVGSIIYRFKQSAWWVDGGMALILACFFVKQGADMVLWARHPDFDGSCCKTCASSPGTTLPMTIVSTTRVLCDCCKEKVACQDAGHCLCVPAEEGVSDGCSCLSDEGASDCCEKTTISNTRNQPGESMCDNTCCAASQTGEEVLAGQTASGGACCTESPPEQVAQRSTCSDGCCV